jgi:hypothetical protein
MHAIVDEAQYFERTGQLFPLGVRTEKEMRSRKLNPDRVRRHMARSTPDRTQIHLDPMDDAYQYKYNTWLRTFAKRMRIKHGPEVQIEIFHDPMLAQFPNGMAFVALVRKEKS